MELELWRPVVAVHVYVPGCSRPCGANDCQLPAVGHVVWLEPGQLRGEEICAWHTFRMKGHVRALWFALDTMPALEVLALRVEAHLEQQRQAQQMQRMQAQSHFYYQGTGMGTGWNTSSFTFTNTTYTFG